jgi:hypothetical protein
MAAGMAGLLVLGAAPVLGYFGWDVLRNSKAGTQAETIPEVKFPSTPTAMLAVVNDQKVVTALAVLVLAPGTAKGGTLVSFPTNSNRAQTADDATLPVAESVITTGPDGLLSDLESISSVTLSFNAVATEADMAAMLAPVGPMPMSLPNAVVDSSADGKTTTLFPAGTTTLSPGQAASVLAATDATKAELPHLQNVRAVWNGLASAVGVGLEPSAALSPAPTSFDDFLAHFYAGPIQVYNDLNTQPIGGAANPDKLDVGSLDRAAVVLVMSGLAPAAMIAPYPNLSFRIENGLTDADIAAAGLTGMTSADLSRDIVAELLFLQSNVISVSPEVFTLETLQVPDRTITYTSTDVQTSEARAFSDLFGDVDFLQPSISFPLVDVVMVIGRNYLDFVKQRLQASSPTAPPGVTATTIVDPTAATVSS